VAVSLEEVFSTALAFPMPERARLAHALLVSLDEGPEDTAEPDVQSAWLAEIERRAQSVADGTATLVDWDAARERIEARLRERRAAQAAR
jgi:putative addiction module component (TIGR02574 family)